jgi:magnesium-transporting ATPase (P-type)
MVLGEQFPEEVFQTPYGSYTVTSSLAVVVGFTMVKEAVEDRKRYRKDQTTNARITSTLDASGNFEPTEWKDVKVGNIVKVMDREEVPADLILLSSVNKDGGCYVETSNIDGETNLKIREAEPRLAEFVRSNGRPDPFKVTELRGELRCEAPNKNIHSFVGRIDIEQCDKPIAVGSKQFLLRGSQLRNTPWIWGIVVYTGPETKVMKNSRDAPSKLSILEQTMNKCIMLVLLTQMLVCSAGAIAACAWSDDNALYYKNWLSSSTETVLASPWEKYHSQFFTFVGKRISIDLFSPHHFFCLFIIFCFFGCFFGCFFNCVFNCLLRMTLI